MNISFTGHRPNKLGGYDWNSKLNQELIKKLEQVILDQLNSDLVEVNFIFGGALGIDQMAFDICERNISKFPNCKIRLILALPFEKQDSNWIGKTDKERYAHQKSIADKIVYVDAIPKYSFKGIPLGEYHPAKMQLRNQWMVDNSDRVIAVFDGSKGGTANCINYAKKKKKFIVILHPKTFNAKIIFPKE